MGWRQVLLKRSPEWSRRVFGPVMMRLDMLLVDHGIFRVFYLNKHRIGDKAWRSAQPAPYQIGGMARQGLRTIINLRDARECGSYWLEEEACRRHGIALVNFRTRSREAPPASELHAARDLLRSVEYPMLMHCKSGADRAGLMSVLYRHVVEGEPIETARNQLSAWYGHFRDADTGVLDRIFDAYVEQNALTPMTFFEWVDTHYDPDRLRQDFRAKGWANRLVNRILKRE